jgi:hypothetical protein
MAISRFLNPEDEDEEEEPPSPEEVLAVINEAVGASGLAPEHEQEEDSYALPPILSLKEAIFYVRDFLAVADEKEKLMDFEDVRALQRIKRKLEAVVVNSRKQNTLDNWLAL